MSVQKVLLCPFYFKTRPSGLSLASKGLQNIPQVPENPFEVRQNYDAKGGLIYSFSLKVKWGFISARKLEGERSKNVLCPFHCKPRPSGVSLESLGLKTIPQIPGNRTEVGQGHDARTRVVDIDQVWLNFPELGGSFSVPGTLN